MMLKTALRKLSKTTAEEPSVVLSSALQRRVDKGELSPRAALVEHYLGDGASEHPASWALAISSRLVPQADGTMHQHPPWPRPVKPPPNLKTRRPQAGGDLPPAA